MIRLLLVLAAIVAFVAVRPWPAAPTNVRAQFEAGAATDATFTSHTCPAVQFEVLYQLRYCRFVVELDMAAPEDGPYYWAGLRSEAFSCASLKIEVKAGGGAQRIWLPPGVEMGARKILASQQPHRLEVEIRATRLGKPKCARGNPIGWAMSMSVSTHLAEPVTFDAQVEGRNPERASPGDTIKYRGAGWKAGNGPVKVYLGRKLLKAFTPRSFAGSFKWTGFPKPDTCATVLKAVQGSGENKIQLMIPLGPGPVIDVAWAHEVKIGGPHPRQVGADSYICEYETDFIRLGPRAELFMMPFKDFKGANELGDLPGTVASTAFKITAYSRPRSVEIGNIVAPTVVFHSKWTQPVTMYGDPFREWSDADPCPKAVPVNCPGRVKELDNPDQFYSAQVVLENENRAEFDVDFRGGLRMKNAFLWAKNSIAVTGDGPGGGLQGKGAIVVGGNLLIRGPLKLDPEGRYTIGVYSGVLTIEGCVT